VRDRNVPALPPNYGCESSYDRSQYR